MIGMGKAKVIVKVIIDGHSHDVKEQAEATRKLLEGAGFTKSGPGESRENKELGTALERHEFKKDS